jgi:hypothetical protein
MASAHCTAAPRVPKPPLQDTEGVHGYAPFPFRKTPLEQAWRGHLMGADRGDDTEAGKLPGVQWHGLCIQYGQMGVIARRVRSVGGLAWAVGEWLGCGVWGAARRATMQELRSPRNQASQGKRAIRQAGPWRYSMWAVSMKNEAEGMHTPHTRGSTHHGCWVWCGGGVAWGCAGVCVCVMFGDRVI